MVAMKLRVRQDYYRRVRRVLELSLKGGNTVKAINTWAVAALRYTAGIVDWTADELKAMYNKNRKLVTMNGALNPRADVDRLYVTQGRGWMPVEDVVRVEEHSLSNYLKRAEIGCWMCLWKTKENRN